MLDCVSGRRRIPPRDTSLSTAATTKLGDLTTSEHGAFSAAGGQQPARSEFQAEVGRPDCGSPAARRLRSIDTEIPASCQSPADGLVELLLEGRERDTKSVVSPNAYAQADETRLSCVLAFQLSVGPAIRPSY